MAVHSPLRRALIAAVILAVLAAVTGYASRADAAAPGPGTNYATDDPFVSARTAWWRNAGFGMFIHFGAYSQLEGEYTRPDGTVCRNAEWIKRTCKIPMAE